MAAREDGAAEPFRIHKIGDVAASTDADDGDGLPEGLSEIHGSLCMNCGEEGTTRMLMTKIPFFREIILSSFECDTCGWTNNEVLFGGELQERGCRFQLAVKTAEDTNRQVIKSDYATIFFPEIDFEIPPAKERRGEITTIEGLLSTAAERLGEDQAARAAVDPDLALKIGEVIMKLGAMARGDDGSLPFTLVVDDPSGNSFVENRHAPKKDPDLKTHYFKRTAAQDLTLGLQPTDPAAGERSDAAAAAAAAAAGENGGASAAGAADCSASAEDAAAGAASGALAAAVGADPSSLRGEVLELPEMCPQCGAMGDTRVCVTDIPHFKEVVIMAFDCPACAYKSNEVKGGGAVPPRGTRHVLKAIVPADLGRDVLKSDTASLFIPELELEMSMGTLGGLYTTVEGLLEKVRDGLVAGNPFVGGDSATNHHGSGGSGAAAGGGSGEDGGGVAGRFAGFLERLTRMGRGEALPFTLQLQDPLGNSFIGCLGELEDPSEDPQLDVEDYDRTFEEDEDLGLNDINTAPFETRGDEAAMAAAAAAASGGGDATQRAAAAAAAAASSTGYQRPQQHRVGTDHPVAFTKGSYTDDNTVYNASVAVTNAAGVRIERQEVPAVFGAEAAEVGENKDGGNGASAVAGNANDAR